jgi:hypothetical protein
LGLSGKYSIADGGWMKVTAGRWQLEKERRHRITIKIVINKYSKELEFTVFKGLEGMGFDLVLGKPWLRLHNRMHEIDHFKNEIWITNSDSETYHLIGLVPEDEDRTARAKELGLHTIIWREVRVLHHRNKKVNFF